LHAAKLSSISGIKSKTFYSVQDNCCKLATCRYFNNKANISSYRRYLSACTSLHLLGIIHDHSFVYCSTYLWICMLLDYREIVQCDLCFAKLYKAVLSLNQWLAFQFYWLSLH